MAQKTILSFFKQTDKLCKKIDKEPVKNSANGESSLTSIDKKINVSPIKTDVSEKENSSTTVDEKPNVSPIKSDVFENDSPVKNPNKRKRIKRLLESDDEESLDTQETKKEKSEMNLKENKPNGSACDINKENNEKPETSPVSLKNGKSSKKSVKRKKNCVESDEEVDSSAPIKKEKLDDDVESNTKDSTPDTKVNGHSSSANGQSLSSSTTSPEIIPKRKTARKQMKSSPSLKSNFKADNSTRLSKEHKSPLKPDLTHLKSAKEDNSPVKASEQKADSPEKIETKSEEVEAEKSEEDSPEKKPVKNIILEKIIKTPSTAKKARSSSIKKKVKTESTAKNIHPFFGKNKKETKGSDEEEHFAEDSSKGESADTKISPKEKSAKKDITASSSSGTEYNPSVSRYDPIEGACWKKGDKVPYLALAKTLALIEETSGRLKIIEILSNFFRSVIVLSPSDLLQSIYLCLNRLAPEYEGIELGVGETLLMKAVAQATGRTVDKIKAEVAVKGDLGLVAESSRGTQKLMFAPPKLTVASVFSKFKEIAKMTGNSSMAKKTEKIQTLFVACRDCEAKYIIRSLSGKLRIGLAEQSVLAAIARAVVLTPPNQDYPPKVLDKSSGMSADNFKKLLDSQALILKTTYCECPNYDIIVPVLLKEGIEELPRQCQLSPGRPLKPMLAHPTTGIDEILKRFDKNKFTCEFKYDGERAQIHRNEKGEVKIYSRNQEDNTSKYPDIIKRLPKTLQESTHSFILDTEAVAWDCESKQILPFQVLSTRKKKDAVESEIVVQVCVMAFDLLFLNGESLVKKPLIERRNLLHASFKEIESEFMFVTYRDGNNTETMQEFLDESVKGNCEGLMVKSLEIDASYEIAKRSHNWLKLKKDYLNGIGDTLDLVVIGGYHGKGKRTGVYGGFLLACYDDENEEFQSICKLGTGFDESELKAHSDFLKQHVIDEPKSYYRFDPSLNPDVWFDTVQIWEIKCADLSISPIHRAAIGIVDPEKGISLRFPRFLRIRDDKSKPEEATVSSRIAELYQKQEQIQNLKNKNVKNEEDYY